MFEKIKATLLDYVECDESDIKPETEFMKDLKMTSYDIITMLGDLEDELGVNFEEEEMQGILTVGDLDAFLTEKLA